MSSVYYQQSSNRYKTKHHVTSLTTTYDIYYSSPEFRRIKLSTFSCHYRLELIAHALSKKEIREMCELFLWSAIDVGSRRHSAAGGRRTSGCVNGRVIETYSPTFSLSDSETNAARLDTPPAHPEHALVAKTWRSGKERIRYRLAETKKGINTKGRHH